MDWTLKHQPGNIVKTLYAKTKYLMIQFRLLWNIIWEQLISTSYLNGIESFILSLSTWPGGPYSDCVSCFISNRLYGTVTLLSSLSPSSLSSSPHNRKILHNIAETTIIFWEDSNLILALGFLIPRKLFCPPSVYVFWHKRERDTLYLQQYNSFLFPLPL